MTMNKNRMSIAAARRLERDGSMTLAAMQGRLKSCVERGISPAERDVALRSVRRNAGAAGHLKLIDFCERHGVSLDWVYFGSLATLRTMTRPQPEPTPEQILLVMRQLPPLERAILYKSICARAGAHTQKNAS